MSDRPKSGNTTLIERISEEVARKMAHIPLEKRRKKVRSAWGWWIVAALAGALSCFICYRVIEAAMGGTNVPTALALLAIGLPVFVALFAANMASGEATRATLAAILSFGRGARGVVKGEPPEAQP